MADRIIAVRTGKTVYRDGDTAVKVFDADYAKPDILSEALNQARVAWAYFQGGCEAHSVLSHQAPRC